jgi:sugar phosphate isomerase/epimerase
MGSFKIGIDNYGLYPLSLSPLQTLQWALSHGCDGVAFSGLNDEIRKNINSETLKDLSEFANVNEMYIEWGGGQHIPRDMNSWQKKELFENNKKVAREAELLGTRIVRSCSGGLMRWNPDNPSTETLLYETAQTLRSQREMLKDFNIILAIETHFEFTTFELLRLFEMCDTEPGEYLGICLDTMNLLTMLEDPLMATERILPWVVSTHIKDGGILSGTEGMLTYTTETGKGIVDLEQILGKLESLEREVNLSIEDHGGEFLLPVNNPQFMAEFPDLSEIEYASLKKLAAFSRGKRDKGENSILDREKWPELCETRLASDIQNLKELVQHLDKSTD